MDFSARPLDEKELLRRLLEEKEETPKSGEDNEDAPEAAAEEEQKVILKSIAIEQKIKDESEVLRKEREKNNPLENQVAAYAESFKPAVQEQKEYGAGGQFGGDYTTNTQNNADLYAWQEETHKLHEPDDKEARKKRAIL
ncbi:hypothetical protein HZA98_04260 [Candidatus Woesearchaeota archaeon]|nr:hypothetical protein [Candidatus Woesearchaeota archaeon]